VGLGRAYFPFRAKESKLLFLFFDPVLDRIARRHNKWREALLAAIGPVIALKPQGIRGPIPSGWLECRHGRH